MLSSIGVPPTLMMEAAMKTALKLKAAKTTKTAKTAKTAKTKRQAPSHIPALVAIDALLDEALGETFPASDPVALTQPSRQRRAALKKHTGRRAG
jgi:hypothetical protein